MVFALHEAFETFSCKIETHSTTPGYLMGMKSWKKKLHLLKDIPYARDINTLLNWTLSWIEHPLKLI